MSPALERMSKGGMAGMFSALAPEYERFNRWSSLGLDQRWRRKVVECLGPTGRVLDLGTGTGDLASRIQTPERTAVGVDLSPRMLDQARARHPDIQWVQGSADQLPFAEGSFDAVVSAFVVRNLLAGGVLPSAVREVTRVLRPGGRLVFLDLTRPSAPFLRWGHWVYTHTVMPLVGRMLFAGRWPGKYLAASIEALPRAETFERLFQECGLTEFEFRPLWGGVVSLIMGRK